MKIQVDDQTRDATDEEVARIKTIRDGQAQALAALEQAAAARESARTKLKALGLTDDEIAALAP